MTNEHGMAERYVRLAMDEAQRAAKTGNRPFGAIIVAADGGLAISEHNRVE